MSEPVIKWTGSKRSQATELLKYFPKEIDTYYEPFCGGASMLRRLLESDIRVNKYCCSDINSDLIGLWQLIKREPESVAKHYKELWLELNQDDDKERKKQYFYYVRERFNKEKSPLDFMFIMRTTTNGMPRYNKNGEFNNSFHVTRDGIKPDRLRTIIYDWCELLNNKNVSFEVKNYQEIMSNEGDFLYLDPPYAATKGIYFGKIDYETLWEWLRNQKGQYIMSFDGKSGEVDSTYAVPNDVYSEHIYIMSGNSSFKRTIGKSNDSIVYESLYIK